MLDESAGMDDVDLLGIIISKMSAKTFSTGAFYPCRFVSNSVREQAQFCWNSHPV